MKALTERQAQILAYIEACQERQQRSPTIREIGKYLGVRSLNAVNDHLGALETKGFISRDKQTARGIRVLTTPRLYSSEGDTATIVLPETALFQLSRACEKALSVEGAGLRMFVADAAIVKAAFDAALCAHNSVQST